MGVANLTIRISNNLSTDYLGTKCRCVSGVSACCDVVHSFKRLDNDRNNDGMSQEVVLMPKV